MLSCSTSLTDWLTDWLHCPRQKRDTRETKIETETEGQKDTQREWRGLQQRAKDWKWWARFCKHLACEDHNPDFWIIPRVIESSLQFHHRQRPESISSLRPVDSYLFSLSLFDDVRAMNSTQTDWESQLPRAKKNQNPSPIHTHTHTTLDKSFRQAHKHTHCYLGYGFILRFLVQDVLERGPGQHGRLRPYRQLSGYRAMQSLILVGWSAAFWSLGSGGGAWTELYMNLLLVGDWQQLFWTRTLLLLLAAAAAADGHSNVADDCGYSSVQRRSSSRLLLLLFLLLFPAVLHVRITATTTNDDNLLRFVHSSFPPWALVLRHRNLSQSNQPSTRCSASPAVGYERLPSLSASPADGRETSELL